MLSRFKAHNSEHHLMDAGDRILLAVSGGLDSMVMLHLFQEADYQIGVAHCNFQLRGNASDEEEEFIKHECDRLGIDFYCQRFNTKNYAEEAHVSIQMAARELRYAWFGDLLEQKNYHWLATAHHRDDNMETVLMRWIKGGGLDQLTGIPIRNGKVIRPLLFATRDEIHSYATGLALEWIEDSSNSSDDYQRNFIRHQVIPKLREINPALDETFGNSLEKTKGAFEMMQRGLGQLKDSITRQEGPTFMIDKTLLALLQYPAFVCYEWLRPFGFEWDRCVQLATSLQSTPGKQFLSATHLAVIDREFIIVSPREEWSHEILVEEGQKKVGLGPWALTVSIQHGNQIKSEQEQGTFDKALVRFPLVWRKWRKGDSFFPLGLGHRKKVSDFLIDEKVPLNTKNTVTVVESGGEILWVVGFRVDDRFKVTSTTTSTVLLQLGAI
jgi:tRNA(Ile)-lysidine synthase